MSARDVFEKFQFWRFVRFTLAGGGAALANFSSRFLFSLATPYEIAVVLAYLVGMLTSFLAFKYLVFERSGKTVGHEGKWFVLVNLASLAQVWIVSVVLYYYGLPAIEWTWRPQAVAHAIGVASPILTSYFAHKHLTFAPQKKASSSLGQQ